MRDPELVARAGYAAARLEQAWERWRALHGLGGSSDPLASYVGYSHHEPMGQPRVVIGVDAAEAEYFADFLESHECAGLAQTEPRPVNGLAHRPVDGSAPAPRDVPSEPMVRLADPMDPGPLTGAATAERARLTGPAPSPGPGTRIFHHVPVAQGGLYDQPESYDPPGPYGPQGPYDPQGSHDTQDPSDPLAAELAGWASGELPGQASEQMASWGAAEVASARAMDRPRSAR